MEVGCLCVKVVMLGDNPWEKHAMDGQVYFNSLRSGLEAGWEVVSKQIVIWRFFLHINKYLG